MFRLLFRFLILLIVIALVRYLFAAVSRAISQTFNPQTPTDSAPSSGTLGGELKQVPVCGTYVSTKTSVKKTINGELVHFCSIDCRDKFKVA